MTWHVWHTRPRHPPFPITDSRFIPPTGVGGTSPENQKNGTTLLKITQLKIYAKFRLVTFAAPGVGQVLDPTAFANAQPALSQMSTVHYTTMSGTQYELVNQLGGFMIGGSGTVSYLIVPSAVFNNGGPGYLHRIPLAFYDSLTASGGDFTSATVLTRTEMDVASVRQIGAYVATIGANGQMTDPEALLRVGTNLLVGAALGKPGEITAMITDVANKYGVPPALSTIAGIGTEIVSKFLLISNPVGWVRMVAGMVGVSNLTHIGAGSQEAAQVQTEFGTTVDAGYAEMKQLKTETGENYVAVKYDNYTRYLMKNAQGEISDSRVSNNGTESCTVGTGPSQSTFTWDASTASGTLLLSDSTTKLDLHANDVITLSDQAWTINRINQSGAASAEIVAQRIKNSSNVCGITINGQVVVGDIGANSVTVDNGNGTSVQVTTPNGDPALAFASAQQLASTGSASALAYVSNIGFGVEHVVMSARYTDTLTGKLQKEIIGKSVIGLDGVATNRTETTIFLPDGKTPAKYISDLQNNDGLHETRVVGFSNGIKYDVMLGYDAQGEPYVSNVISINGAAPADAVLATSKLQSRGLALALKSGDSTISLDAGVNTAIADELAPFNAHPTGAQTLYNALAGVGNAVATYAPPLIDALTLIKAIQTGQPLPILASGLRVANDLSPKVDALGNAIAPNYALSGVANAASGVLSLMSLDAALQRGDTLGALTAGAQTLSFGTQAYANLVLNNSANLVGGSTQATYEFLNGTPGTPGVLPYLNIINSIANGDSVGVAVAVVDMVLMDAAVYSVPYIGWVYAVYTIIDSLFSDNTPPEAWGSAHAQWTGFTVTSSAVGGFGGLEAASQTYNGMLSYLDQLAAQQQTLNPGSSIGVIANRLPSLSYRNYSGYQITDIDPLTGVQKNPEIKYDLTGRPYSAPAGSVQASQSLTERMIRVALERGAIAPSWEVQTAALQTLAGDPMAGLTEEERAGRAGLLAPQPAAGATTQIFRAVALDLNGDGVQTTGAAQTVAFDVDNRGYLKNTAWLSNSDGFLFLDRNLNGQIDAGSELFSNSAVALGARGLNGMRWVDSNYDGRLSTLDPVWNELKVWQDANGNGSADAGEVQTLGTLGISALDYAMGTFTQNGQFKQLASPDLVADTQGTRTHVVPEGIILQTSQGQTSLLVTQIDDKSLLEANRDGITSFEDTETIISAADLLANDTLAGLSGQNLSITGVSGFTHGTGYLDNNGFIHYTPAANYFGAANEVRRRIAA